MVNVEAAKNDLKPASSQHPDQIRASQIGYFIGDGNKYEALGDLSEEQLRAMILYSAFNSYLKRSGIEGGIDPIIEMLDQYVCLSPSLRRMGRQEAVTVLQAAGRQTEYLRAPYDPEKEAIAAKKSPWWKFWGKE